MWLDLKPNATGFVVQIHYTTAGTVVVIGSMSSAVVHVIIYRECCSGDQSADWLIQSLK